MRIAVLASPSSWHLQDLARAAQQAGHDLTVASFRDLAATVTAEQAVQVRCGPVDLAAHEGVIVRSMPAGSLEQIVFRMDALAELERRGVRVVNPAKAIEAAVDKFLTTARLRAAGLAIPRTIACQQPADAAAAWEMLGGDVVSKPLFGGEGRGLCRFRQAAELRQAAQEAAAAGAVLYLQEFIPHPGRDLRILVVGEELWGISRCNPHDWRTNISLGGVARRIEVTDELAQLARQATAAVGATVAGVDLLPADDGRLLVLEVNAVPGWRALSQTLGVDVAASVWRLAAGRRA